MLNSSINYIDQLFIIKLATAEQIQACLQKKGISTEKAPLLLEQLLRQNAQKWYYLLNVITLSFIAELNSTSRL